MIRILVAFVSPFGLSVNIFNMEKKPRGRPKKTGDWKRVILSTTVDSRTKARIQKIADDRGISMGALLDLAFPERK